MSPGGDIMSIKTFKRRLATVDSHSWHYQITETVFNASSLRRSKACAYFWFRVPMAVFIVAVGWFFGYYPHHDSKRKGIFGDCKELPASSARVRQPKRHQRVSPVEVMLGLVLLVVAYYLTFVNGDLGLKVFAGLIAAAIVLGLLYWLTKVRFFAFLGRAMGMTAETAGDLYDHACPPLHVVDGTSPDHDDDHESWDWPADPRDRAR